MKQITRLEIAEHLREKYQITIPQPANLKHLASDPLEYTSKAIY